MKKHNIARAAVSAGLAIAMTFGGIAPATMAFADTAANSTITINNVTGNKTSFNGYEIFQATVTDNADGTKSVSAIKWANTDVETAVKKVITANGGTAANTATAQDAADWIKDHVTSTTDVSVSNPVAEAIAKAVMDKTAQATVTGGTASSALDNGYWLFVTDRTTVDSGSSDKAAESYTLPIFAVVGGKTVTVTEKASIPTVEKKIVSDADNTEYDAADSHIGQDVRYNLYGTVAQDFATYDSYSYKFTDTVSAGLTIDQSSVKVYMYGSDADAKSDVLHNSTSVTRTDVTDYFTSGVADGTDGAHVLTVNVNSKTAPKGLKSITGATKDSVFVVSYTAKINSSAVIGNAGNPNTVYLEYSNNPNGEGTGRTVDHHVTDFTYGLNLVKVDQGTEKALQGAVFTIQVTKTDGNADTTSLNKYVKADGTLTANADEAHLTTDANGKIDVTGLDAGTYTVHEVSAPSGYSTVSDFSFTISPTLDQKGQTITKLESTLNATDSTHVIAGLSDGTAGDNKLTPAANSGVTDNKIVNITVGDTKSVGLPLTGQAGVTLTFVAGALVLAFGVSRVVRNRKEQDAE
jgi:fimbrial isopeptide formation D2 family protein